MIISFMFIKLKTAILFDFIQSIYNHNLRKKKTNIIFICSSQFFVNSVLIHNSIIFFEIIAFKDDNYIEFWNSNLLKSYFRKE